MGTTDRSSGGPSCRDNAPIKSPAIPQSHPQEYKWLWPPLKSHNTQGSGVRHIYTWIMHTEYKVCLRPPLNEELVKMLYFHYRNIRQLFGEQRKAGWLGHDDLSASSWQGQRVFLIIFIIMHHLSLEPHNGFCGCITWCLAKNGTSIFIFTWA